MDTTPARHQRILEIFEATFEAPPDERDRILEAECADDPDLRLEVERVIAKHEADGTFLDRPVLGRDFRVTWETLLEETPADRIGQQIGDFTLRRVIATGGMGTVYEAEQDRPRRTLAVKVMKRGITSQSALKRFEYESQILAHLRHPGIAHVYEAGRCGQDGDVPYFAMEFIADAKPITDYAKDRKLNTRQRLDLFTKVCDAVHHGHQRGVIHRDLKPSNILVDADGEPKVIDFGVARATDSDIAITTLQTDVGQLIGTLQYMSPEQCEGHAHDLDTRSDVYSLGVVLYELLCDQVPYDVSSGTVPQAIQVIREETPARPSTINRALRGDLETITLKALEKERQRRYDSAAALADDVRRYFNDEPIVARPASAIYQFRKFARRNKGLVTAGCVVFAALAVTTIVSVSLAISIERARRAEEAQRIAAEERSATLNAVDLLMREIIQTVDPRQGAGRSVVIREVLDTWADRVDEDYANKPATLAALHHQIGSAYAWPTGLFDQAIEHLGRAVEMRESELGAEHDLTLKSKFDLARALGGNGEYARAVGTAREVFMTSSRVFGEFDPGTLTSQSTLSFLLNAGHLYEEALVLVEDVLEKYESLYGEDHETVFTARGRLANVLTAIGRLDEAEAIQRGQLAVLRDRSDPNDGSIASQLNDLSHTLIVGRRWAEAEMLLVEANELMGDYFGSNHPHAIDLRMAYANALYFQRRYEEVEPLFRRVFNDYRAAFPNHLAEIARATHHLADVLGKLGEHEEAEQLVRNAVDTYEELELPNWEEFAHAREVLSVILQSTGRLDEAMTIYGQIVEMAESGDRKLEPRAAFAEFRIGSIHRSANRLGQAEQHFRASYDLYREAWGDTHPFVIDAMTQIAATLRDDGRYEAASEIFESALDVARQNFPDDTRRRGYLRVGYGRCLYLRELFDESEEHLLAGYSDVLSVKNEQHVVVQSAVQNLVDLYNAWDKPAKAAEWRAKLPEPADDAAPDS